MNVVEWFGFKAYEDNLPATKAGVYLIQNLVNGKYYVGESGNVRERLQNHSFGQSPRKLRNAINKYGVANFLVIPVWYATVEEPDKSYQLGLETDLIIEFDSINNGYNILDKYTRNNWGWAHPDNPPDRSWHSEWFKRIHNDPIIGPKIKDARSNPVVIARRAASTRATYAKPGGKDKLIASHNTPEFHELQSAKLTEYFSNPENRQKASDAQAKVAEKHSLSLIEAWEKRPRCWITNGIENKQHFVDLPIPEGWYKGRSGLLGRALAKSRSTVE